MRHSQSRVVRPRRLGHALIIYWSAECRLCDRTPFERMHHSDLTTAPSSGEHACGNLTGSGHLRSPSTTRLSRFGPAVSIGGVQTSQRALPSRQVSITHPRPGPGTAGPGLGHGRAVSRETTTTSEVRGFLDSETRQNPSVRRNAGQGHSTSGSHKYAPMHTGRGGLASHSAMRQLLVFVNSFHVNIRISDALVSRETPRNPARALAAG